MTPTSEWRLRPYRPEDCAETLRLFYETVHRVNARDYTPKQLDAWAPVGRDAAAWGRSLLAHDAVVAECGGRLAGFGDLAAEEGLLDRRYVHHALQGRGIASALLDWLEGRARASGVRRLETFASLTARGFFERRGFLPVAPNTVWRNGVALPNVRMYKCLAE